jgi:tRNA dimethylallyltransferase
VKLALVGSTAAGKSAVAHAFARDRGDVEIIAVDSMTVYRGMDVGTAKPTPAERAEVPYHLLDLVAPSATFTVAAFQRAAREAARDIAARGHHVLYVGGTGLYGRAVLDDLEIPGQYPAVRAELETTVAEGHLDELYQELATADPVAAARMEPSNARRVVRALEVVRGSGRLFSSFGHGLDTFAPTDTVQVGLEPALADVDAAIATRLATWVAAGLLDEVRRLAQEGLSATAAQAVGYKELLAHLQGEGTLENALALVAQHTRQLVRRQRSWFRRDPRITWYDTPAGARAALDALVEATDNPSGAARSRAKDGRLER